MLEPVIDWDGVSEPDRRLNGIRWDKLVAGLEIDDESSGGMTTGGSG